MSTCTDGIGYTTDEDSVIYHVFVYLIGMDQDSFKQVKDWFKHQGISSLEQLLDLHLFDPAFVTDPKYRVNGQTQYLDSWITDNFSSICNFSIDILKKYKVPIATRGWLNFKSRNDCQKYGLKLHHPPKVISKPIQQVDVIPTPVIKMAPVAKVNSAPVANTSFNQHLADTPEVIRVPRIDSSKELSNGCKIVDSNKATSTPMIPKTQAPKVS